MSKEGARPVAGAADQVRGTTLLLTPRAPFDFQRTVYSHGWVSLLPNAWNPEQQALERVQRLHTGRVVLLRMAGRGSVDEPGVEVCVEHVGALADGELEEALMLARRMLRADEDLGEFYALCRQRGGRWVGLTRGLGRLLRSPTLFEDVVKTICTTNIAWGGTRRMVERMVAAYGEPWAGDAQRRAFPTADATAADSAEAFAETVRAGYRSPYLHALAEQVASGALDLEALRDEEMPTAELRKRLLAIKGVGRYAAANLLMLLGRYDELPVDTEFRSFVSARYFGGGEPSDKEARAIYDQWGRWKFLAYWFELLESAEGS